MAKKKPKPLTLLEIIERGVEIQENDICFGIFGIISSSNSYQVTAMNIGNDMMKIKYFISFLLDDIKNIELFNKIISNVNLNLKLFSDKNDDLKTLRDKLVKDLAERDKIISESKFNPS